MAAMVTMESMVNTENMQRDSLLEDLASWKNIRIKRNWRRLILPVY